MCVLDVVDVVKGMQALGVIPDVETLTNYILPVFPNMEAARKALKVTLRVRVCVCVFGCSQCALKKIFADIKVIFLYSGFRCVSGVGGLLVFRDSLGGGFQLGRTLQPT